MTIQNWADWIELGRDNFDKKNPLDICQVPKLIHSLKEKFCSTDKTQNLYSGLLDIVQKLLPAPRLGFGLGEVQKITHTTYDRKFYERVESLPLKDGDIFMTAQAFRLALFGKKIFANSNDLEKKIFYSLGTKQKKYILEKQPDLFPFRTPLPRLIASSSLAEIMWEHHPKDLLHDAALFGGEALFEALLILKDMVSGLCLEEAPQLEKILSFYPSAQSGKRELKEHLAYLLVVHQLEILKGKEIADQDVLNLVDSMNEYCQTQDSDTELSTLMFPQMPLQRAHAILLWWKSFCTRRAMIHIPFSQLDKIFMAKELDIAPSSHNPQLLMAEFDRLGFEEKKEFIIQILLERKIEAIPFEKRGDFIRSVEQRSSQPLSACFRLALLCIDFLSPNSTFKTSLPRLQQTEILFEIQAFEFDDKKWFLENVFMHEDTICFYLKGDKLPHFFDLLNDFRTCLGSTYIRPFLMVLEDRALELCPVDAIHFALLNLGSREKLLVCLKKYVSKKIAQGPVNPSLQQVLKKYFDYTEEGIDFIYGVGTLESPTSRFLLSDPGFIQILPKQYQKEIQLLATLIEPISPTEIDPLSLEMERLPLGLKELLMNESIFGSFFEKEVMGRVLSLYKMNCIPAEEMFFLAARLPYDTFLDIAEKCPIDFTKLHPLITFGAVEDTIPGHVEALTELIRDGDRFAEEDLRKFLNRYPQQVIGEGRWIQYLARQVPTLYSIPVTQKIIDLMPMDLVQFVIQFLEKEHQNWFLTPRFEAIFSKNIDRFSLEVQSWLIENLEKWFVMRQDVLEYTLFLWDRPKKKLKSYVELLEETKNLFCLFQQRFSELQLISRKLQGKPGSAKLLEIVEKLRMVKGVIEPWQQRIEEIDIASISDALTDELLDGNVYSLEGNGWIGEITRDRLEANPFNRSPFLTQQDKDLRVPLLKPEEMAELEEGRKKISKQIADLRFSIVEKEKRKKRHT
jgi:hypothetical protein